MASNPLDDEMKLKSFEERVGAVEKLVDEQRENNSRVWDILAEMAETLSPPHRRPSKKEISLARKRISSARQEATDYLVLIPKLIARCDEEIKALEDFREALATEKLRNRAGEVTGRWKTIQDDLKGMIEEVSTQREVVIRIGDYLQQ